jgi:pyruvate carboxylase
MKTKKLLVANCCEIPIQDMAGLLNPDAAIAALVAALKDAVSLPIHLQAHDTSSLQTTTYLKSMELWLNLIDCASSGSSVLTFQPNFNSVLKLLKYQDRAPEFHLDLLNKFLISVKIRVSWIIHLNLV